MTVAPGAKFNPDRNNPRKDASVEVGVRRYAQTIDNTNIAYANDDKHRLPHRKGIQNGKESEA
jgi:hypothetical protein